MYCRSSPQMTVLQLILPGCLEKAAPISTSTTIPKADWSFFGSPWLSAPTKINKTITTRKIIPGVNQGFSDTERSYDLKTQPNRNSTTICTFLVSVCGRSEQGLSDLLATFWVVKKPSPSSSYPKWVYKVSIHKNWEDMQKTQALVPLQDPLMVYVVCYSTCGK